ncbi:MAG: type II secretion system minor pseudopilin GspK [Burkholderiales bacterium]|nr:type II secretion system minor pseudopilin GspK [Burkholderiales bacterium]
MMRRLRQPLHTTRHDGAALVVAMLLTALGAAVAAQMLSPLAGWLAREQRARDTQASYTLADAATAWAQTVLAADARLGPVDHLGELWATPLPPTPVEGGTLEGRINDLQANFNLNSIAPQGIANAANMAVARALFAEAGVPMQLVDTLADAIDRDDVTIDGQSERQRYGRALRNAPLRDYADLIEVPGFTASHVQALAALTVILPEATPINLNTASPRLLALALPNMPRDVFERLLARRTQRPFTDVSEVAPLIGKPLPEGVFGVGSRYFGVEAVIRFAHVAHRLQLRIARPPQGRTSVISRLITNAA